MQYAEGVILDMDVMWSESEPRVPLICFLSMGSDPTESIERLAKSKSISEHYSIVTYLLPLWWLLYRAIECLLFMFPRANTLENNQNMFTMISYDRVSHVAGGSECRMGRSRTPPIPSDSESVAGKFVFLKVFWVIMQLKCVLCFVVRYPQPP